MPLKHSGAKKKLNPEGLKITLDTPYSTIDRIAFDYFQDSTHSTDWLDYCRREAEIQHYLKTVYDVTDIELPEIYWLFMMIVAKYHSFWLEAEFIPTDEELAEFDFPDTEQASF